MHFLNRTDARRCLSTPEDTCRFCGHPHSDRPCDYVDQSDEGEVECSCDDFQLFDSQPMDVRIPLDATLEELRLLAKVATEDGRHVPASLVQEIARLDIKDRNDDGDIRPACRRLLRELEQMAGSDTN